MNKNMATRCLLLLPVLLLSFISVGGCGNRNASDQSETGNATTHVDFGLDLQLPAIPDSLTLPEERAAYATLHFWDHLDFRQDKRCLDTIFMEQNFANFLAVVAFAKKDDAQNAVDRLLAVASARSVTKNLIEHIAAKYLDDPDSPMRSEELYIMFLTHFSTDFNTDESKRIRALHRLDMAMKNRVGTQATDFPIVTSDGKVSNLLALAANDTVLIMFYDPTCELCKAVTANLENSGIERKYRIIAVNVTADRQLWDKTKSTMPSHWINALPLEDIDDNEKYYLPALPSLYLLAPDGTVIMKDMPLPTLD